MDLQAYWKRRGLQDCLEVSSRLPSALELVPGVFGLRLFQDLQAKCQIHQRDYLTEIVAGATEGLSILVEVDLRSLNQEDSPEE